jgi:TonB family protein
MVATLNEGIVFLAPPPSAAAQPATGEQITFAELPGGAGLASDQGLTDGALGTEVGAGPRDGGDRAASTGDAPVAQAAATDVVADSIYLAWEVENPAAFDARSAAPAYPDSLRLNGVEGRVIAQFVVDTTGRVDVPSFVLLESTHGRFTASVREALPRMLFRPAELGGRRIKQLVQLPFVFRIEGRDTTAARDTMAARDSATGVP